MGSGHRPFAVVVSDKRDPTLVVPPGALNCIPKWAAKNSWVSEIRCTERDSWPPPLGLVDDLVPALQDHGLARGRIGTCGEIRELEGLRQRLPDAQFTPATVGTGRAGRRDIVERVRAVKSAWEVEYLEQAQRAADAGMRAFMQEVRPGLKQTLVVTRAILAAQEAGADEANVYMSAGTDPWVWGPYRGDLTFSEGDLVAVEFNARVNGYVAQIARSGVLGRAPTASQRRVMEVGRTSQRRMIERIRPGITGGELWDTGLEPVKQAGLEPYGRYGHGMGLSLAEAFDILARDNGSVQEGFCIEVHCGLYDPSTMASALIGDQLMVRNGTAELLSAVSLDFGPALVAA
jgi:Xaa-Pro aminopeptidase